MGRDKLGHDLININILSSGVLITATSFINLEILLKFSSIISMLKFEKKYLLNTC